MKKTLWNRDVYLPEVWKENDEQEKNILKHISDVSDSIDRATSRRIREGLDDENCVRSW